MRTTIAEVMDGQSKIIQLQTKLIDRLALALLQYGTIEDEELAMIKEAADLQKGLEERNLKAESIGEPARQHTHAIKRNEEGIGKWSI